MNHKLNKLFNIFLSVYKMTSAGLFAVVFEILMFLLTAIVLAVVFAFIGMGIKLGMDAAPKVEGVFEKIKGVF